MGSLKRKEAPAGTPPSKRSKSDQPAKDGFKGKPKGDKPEKAADESKKPAAPVISRLKEEEPLFPRGGGSVLSPLEHKQIQIQAKSDALFEEQSGASGKKAEKGQRKKKRKSEVEEPKTVDEDAVKIESLNYKVCCDARDNTVIVH
jgi:rRNA biogenesis protein RRP5